MKYSEYNGKANTTEILMSERSYRNLPTLAINFKPRAVYANAILARKAIANDGNIAVKYKEGKNSIWLVQIAD